MGRYGELKYSGTIAAGIGEKRITVESGDTILAESGGRYIISSVNNTTVVLPQSPLPGDTVEISSVNNSVNNIINRNNNKIMNESEDLIMNIKNTTVNLVFVNATFGWKVS